MGRAWRTHSSGGLSDDRRHREPVSGAGRGPYYTTSWILVEVNHSLSSCCENATSLALPKCMTGFNWRRLDRSCQSLK